MKKIEITDEQYGALKRLGFEFNDIEEEKEEENKESKFNESWKPKESNSGCVSEKNEFFYIDRNFEIIKTFITNDSIWHKIDENKDLIKCNCFQTYKQAKQRAKEIKIYNLLKNFSDANRSQDNEYWHIIYNLEKNNFYVESFFPCKNMVFGLYVNFDSKEVAEEALRRYEKELDELAKLMVG